MKMINVRPDIGKGESVAVVNGNRILAALVVVDVVDVERDDGIGDDDWSELRDYLASRGVTLANGTASYPERNTETAETD